MIKYDELEVGYKFSPISYELTSSIISKYEEAIEAHSSIGNSIPPLAVAAYAMKAISQSIQLPPGSVHVSQELEFFKPVAVGSHINCQAQITQKTKRAKLNMMVIEINTFDQNKEKVLSGKATLILTDSG